MGRYRSIQSILIESALKGITDNQTITAYKKDCKEYSRYQKREINKTELAKILEVSRPTLDKLIKEHNK